MKRRYQLAYGRAAAEGKVPRLTFVRVGGGIVRRIWSQQMGMWIEQPLSPHLCGLNTEELYKRQLIRVGLLPDPA